MVNAHANENHATQTEKKVLIVGDSLSAEYGLTRGTGWVEHMSQQAKSESVTVQWVNASISGDTTSGGVTRLPSLLKLHQPHIVVIELGGNDALRGLDMNLTQSNLLRMIKTSQTAGAKVLIIAMQVPPNYGANYLKQMSAAYEKVSKLTGAQLNQQFLKGVADDADPLKWFQTDRIHPNESAQPLMMKNIWPQLRKMLQSKP
ncbi:MAG: Esterase TesA precursor [Pseudomonadota bacterium]